MEYTFRISAQDKFTTIRLGEYAMTLVKGDKEEIVSYANMIAVRINKISETVFRMVIHVDGRAPIILSNWSISKDGSKENQSGAYSLFVRVLHHHLKDKSRAVFKAGKNMDRVWVWAAVSILMAATISILLDYLGFNLTNPYVEKIILSVLTFVIILVFAINKLPKTYQPGNIPLQFLP